jgi:hypothetical protein
MIITESFLEQSFNSSQVTLSKERRKRQTANESFNLGDSKDKPIVFLSHKYDEIKPLEQTIELIKSCGVNVIIREIKPSLLLITSFCVDVSKKSLYTSWYRQYKNV